jgi:hypothetical protein
MPDEPATFAELADAAAHLWGPERRAALEGSLRRLARALAAVAAVPLSYADEPYPTGPAPPTEGARTTGTGGGT